MSENLKLWTSVERTDPKHVKPITGKSYQGSSPKPHYLVHKATETFGPCGIGWGFTVLDERIEDAGAGERMSIARVRVWYMWDGKRGEVEHVGGTQFSGTRASGKPFSDEDAPKKSVTDALVKALSLIGFAGDIFMGRWEDSKYVQELNEEAKEAAAPAKQPAKAAVPTPTPSPAGTDKTADMLIEALKLATSVDDLNTWGSSDATQVQIGDLSTMEAARVRAAWKLHKDKLTQQKEMA